jgi:hypothetical protein
MGAGGQTAGQREARLEGEAGDMTVDEFFASYAADFATYDAATVAEHFAYPVQSVGDTDAGPDVTTAGRQEWLLVLDRLLGAYRELGVTGARLHSVQVTRLGHGLHVARVGWTLLGTDKLPVYDFEASYTLVASDGGLRISAIAHNEVPKLRAALADRGGRFRSHAEPAA